MNSTAARALSFMDEKELDFMTAVEMQASEALIGIWNYDSGTFSISRMYSKLIFCQHNFTGELFALDDWLVVDVPQRKGSIRMQMDRSGRYMRSQFKRVSSDQWG